MKKFILFILGIFIAGFAFGQSFKILDTLGNDVTKGTINVTGTVDEILSIKLDVVNTSATSKNVKVRRIITSEISGSENYFCWTQCYGPFTDVSVHAETIAPADTNSKFYGDYKGKGNTGTTSITYVFYDKDNTLDSSLVKINYLANPLGVSTLDKQLNKISQWPNPASSNANFNFTLNKNVSSAEITIFNMLGEKVKNIKLEEIQGSVSLPVNDLVAGVYFYALSVNGKAITTKRLIISR